MALTEFLPWLGGAIIGALAGLAFARRGREALHARAASAESKAAHLEKNESELKAVMSRRDEEFKTLQGKAGRTEADLRAAQTLLQERQTQLEGQRKWVEEQTANLRQTFTTTAAGLLRETTQATAADNRDKLGSLLKPLETQLGDFRQRMDKLHSENVAAGSRLEEHIQNLASTAAAVGSKADNLAVAMRGNIKKQGDWGELQLKVLLEDAGFLEGRHFKSQVEMRGDDGELLRADFVLKLPLDESLVLDAKLTLPAWTDYCATDDPELRKAAMARIVASMRAHFETLVKKDYARHFSKGKSIPYTIMFIPIEAAGIEAFRADDTLFRDAQKQKVILVTPTTLFAVLRLVEAIWKVHIQTANADKVWNEARLFLRKLNTLTGSLTALGEALETAGTKYRDAKGQFLDGPGNLVSIATRMKEFGAEIPTTGKLQAMIAGAASAEVGVESIPIADVASETPPAKS